ncbi:LOW QUALITY PROTEIN: hypothetical protein HID58_054200, partial [Brassica napus]
LSLGLHLTISSGHTAGKCYLDRGGHHTHSRRADMMTTLYNSFKKAICSTSPCLEESIITHLGNSIPNTSSVKETIGVDPKPAGDCTFTGPPLQPTNISRGVGQKAIPTEPSDAQASDSPQQVKPAFVQPQVDKVINMMISEIEGLTELEEVVPPDDTTNLPLCREADEDHDRNIEDAANTQMDIESSSPLGVTEIEFLLSLIEIPSFSLGLSQDEVQRTELIPDTVPALVANDDIGETSIRTRIPHPLFNDYQCDPKIKAFRVEVPPPATADNIDDIYTSMRESAGQNKVFTVGNGLSVTTDEFNDIVDRTKQMTPKYFIPPTSSVDAYERIYFPFCIDKQHWIGVCLHLPDSYKCLTAILAFAPKV